jgi:hypothetical protein
MGGAQHTPTTTSHTAPPAPTPPATPHLHVEHDRAADGAARVALAVAKHAVEDGAVVDAHVEALLLGIAALQWWWGWAGWVTASATKAGTAAQPGRTVEPHRRRTPSPAAPVSGSSTRASSLQPPPLQPPPQPPRPPPTAHHVAGRRAAQEVEVVLRVEALHGLGVGGHGPVDLRGRGRGVAGGEVLGRVGAAAGGLRAGRVARRRGSGGGGGRAGAGGKAGGARGKGRRARPSACTGRSAAPGRASCARGAAAGQGEGRARRAGVRRGGLLPRPASWMAAAAISRLPIGSRRSTRQCPGPRRRSRDRGRRLRPQLLHRPRRHLHGVPARGGGAAGQRAPTALHHAAAAPAMRAGEAAAAHPWP